jgi:hypothetical protein
MRDWLLWSYSARRCFGVLTGGANAGARQDDGRATILIGGPQRDADGV